MSDNQNTNSRWTKREANPENVRVVLGKSKDGKPILWIGIDPSLTLRHSAGKSMICATTGEGLLEVPGTDVRVSVRAYKAAPKLTPEQQRKIREAEARLRAQAMREILGEGALAAATVEDEPEAEPEVEAPAPVTPPPAKPSSKPAVTVRVHKR